MMIWEARFSEHFLLRLLSLILRNLQLINHSFDFNYNIPHSNLRGPLLNQA